MINIGLLGLGTVGAGVVEILNNRQEVIKNRTGLEIRIKKILVRDINKDRGIDLDKGLLTTSFEEILNDEEIDIVVEATGDLEKSYLYLKKSLESGKHIVTANKALVSKYLEELSQLAEKNGLAFLYEASVGGGIPVLKTLKEELVLNEISEVQGILNGTCNYILTRMVNEGIDYKEILRTAQELGYAEADPSADVEGHDTLRKLRILASLAFQGKVDEEDILLDGINNIKLIDLDNIKKMNSTIKLIGEAKSNGNEFTAIVQPVIIKNDSYFASVNMSYNSIAFKGDKVGELKFYGAGAGKLPTANAVLSDVLDIVNNTYRKENPIGIRKLKNINKTLKGKYYLRISSENKANIKEFLNITDNTLNMAIVTKEVTLVDLLDLIKKLGIEREEYFLARIME